MSLPTITEWVNETTEPDISLTLTFALRQKSRLRTRLDNNQEVCILMSHGTILRPGMLLRTDTGLIVKVAAALETVSTASTDIPLLLARACYHLGNRHVPLQIDQGWVRYLHDPVLDVMLRILGLHVIQEHAPFDAEAGAYSAGHHHGS